MIFEDLNPNDEPITLKTKPDENGNQETYNLVPRLKTVDDIIQLSRLGDLMKKSKLAEDVFNFLCDMMVLHMGKDREFWKKFSMNLLDKLNAYLNELDKKSKEDSKKKITAN